MRAQGNQMTIQTTHVKNIEYDTNGSTQRRYLVGGGVDKLGGDARDWRGGANGRQGVNNETKVRLHGLGIAAGRARLTQLLVAQDARVVVDGTALNGLANPFPVKSPGL